MDNHRKENLLPIIYKNVNTYNHIDDNVDYRTSIYSDCFSVYRTNDFNIMDYLFLLIIYILISHLYIFIDLYYFINIYKYVDIYIYII